jgi:formate-dependent phosphoribosylglycinamide formyltransferase (GAR transformylase)
MIGTSQRRLLVLCTTTGYQTSAFIEAAQKLRLSITFGTDRCHVLKDPWQDGALPLRFEDPEESAQKICDFAASHPLDAIVSVGDRPTATGARACHKLGLRGHPPEAADICRDKYRSRERLRDAGLEAPPFRRFPLQSDPRPIVASREITFPCVLKPLALSGSRGVIRADTPAEFVEAFERIRRLLQSSEVRVLREQTSKFIQVENYIDGLEIAVEGLVDRGKLRVLAIFDKPDPLVGPFFEETIYVTPSRLEPSIQAAVARTLQRAVDALGLFHGPLHAELRVAGLRIEDNCNWILEIAARPIGGLCARSLRFGSGISLEELIIRHALDEPVTHLEREKASSGVMMIPIPREGIYQGVEQLEQAAQVPGIEAIEITAKLRQKLVPLPEGSSYLGFIFARGDSSQYVESALREAHRQLHFIISPSLPVV